MVGPNDYITKADLRYELQELRAEMRVGFAELRTELERNRSEFRVTFADHQWHVFAAIMGQYALIIGLYGLIISRLH